MALKLDKLTVKELDDVIAEAQQRKQLAYEEMRTQTRDRIDAILVETDFTLDELYGIRAGRKPGTRSLATKSKKPAKFHNPDNPQETWSGYGGRIPRWFANAINRGVSESALLISGGKKAPAAAKKARVDVKAARGAPKTANGPRRR